MIQQLMLGGSSIHTSTQSGIDTFFIGIGWNVSSATSGSFTFTYTPGIPVKSSIRFYTSGNFLNRTTIVTINPGQSDEVSTVYNLTRQTINFSGTINYMRIFYETTDPQGDNFSVQVTEIDGSQNYGAKLTSTTMLVY